MLKLLKYEFVKIRTAIFVVLGAAAVLELMNVVGAALLKYNSFEEVGGDYEDYLETTSYLMYSFGMQIYSFSVILLVIACFSAAVFVAIFALVTMNNDFCKKQGYNVFLTPNSSYVILGAKYITTFLIFAGYALICVLLVAVDVNIFCWVEGDEFIEFFEDFIIPLLEDTGINFALMLVGMALQYSFNIVLLGFTLILSQTLVKATGFLKVLLVFGAYTGINSLVSAIISTPSFFLMNNIDEDNFNSLLNIVYGCTSIGYAIFCVVLFFISAKLIDNKLSL